VAISAAREAAMVAWVMSVAALYVVAAAVVVYYVAMLVLLLAVTASAWCVVAGLRAMREAVRSIHF
jgi:hypothetical protein